MHVYLWLPMFTRVYLFFKLVYLCLTLFTLVDLFTYSVLILHVYAYVYHALFTLIYLHLPLLIRACLPMFTLILVFTYVYHV